MKRIIILITLVCSVAWAGGRLQNEDFKSLTELTSAGGSASQLLNDTKVYVTANGINEQLSEAIATGKIGGAGSGGGINILSQSNPGCEFGTPPDNYVVSGGTLTSETTNIGLGAASCSWDPSASGQTFQTATVAIPQALRGGRCDAKFYYQWNGTQGDLVARVEDGSGNLQGKEVTLIPGTLWTPAQIFFTCPNSGDLRIEIESTADTSAVLSDVFELGKVNITSAVPTNETFQNILSADININTTAGSLTFSDLEIGATYDFQAKIFGRCNSADNAFTVSAINNGASVGAWSVGGSSSVDLSGASFTGRFVAAASTLTFTTTGIDATGSCTLFGNGTIDQTVAYLEKRNDLGGPKNAVSVEAAGRFVKAALATTSSNIPLSNGTSAFPSINFATGEIINFGNITAHAACLNVDGGDGTNCNSEAVNEYAGFTFDPHVTGEWEVCATINQSVSASGSGSGLISEWYMARITLDGSSTLARSNRFLSHRFTLDTGGGTQAFQNSNPVCGTFNFSNLDRKRFELQLNQSAVNGGSTGNTLNVGGGGTPNTYRLVFTAKPTAQNVAALAFTDISDSLATKANHLTPGMRIFSAEIQNDGTVLTEYGDWIDSTAGGGTGIRDVNINSGYCTAVPVCTVSPESSFGTCATIGNINQNVVQVRTGVCGGSASNSSFLLKCECLN